MRCQRKQLRNEQSSCRWFEKLWGSCHHWLKQWLGASSAPNICLEQSCLLSLDPIKLNWKRISDSRIVFANVERGGVVIGILTCLWGMTPKWHTTWVSARWGAMPCYNQSHSALWVASFQNSAINAQCGRSFGVKWGQGKSVKVAAADRRTDRQRLTDGQQGWQ